MNKPKLLYLTKVGKVVNEKGRQKIDMAIEKEKSMGNNSGEMPKSWYLENGLKPPADLDDEPEIDEEGFINLTEEEMEDTYFRVVLNYDDFGMVIDNEDYTTVYTKSGMYVEVYETAKQVNKQIKKLFRTY